MTHLEADGAKVTRVHYRDPTGAARSVRAATVVVACSAIESARLLLLSGQRDPAFAQRANPNGLVGAYFLTHCFGGGQCVVPLSGRADKSKTLDSDWATDHCATPQFLQANGLWAGGAIYNNTFDGALPISLARTWQAADMDNMWKGYLSDPKLVGAGFENYLEHNFGRSCRWPSWPTRCRSAATASSCIPRSGTSGADRWLTSARPGTATTGR